jgi:large subunit ribosomal protein L28
LGVSAAPGLDKTFSVVQFPPSLRTRGVPPDIAERAWNMAKSDITGKRKLRAQNVSHSNIKTKRWQNVNIQTRRVWLPEAGRFVTLNLTTRDIRTIDKIGAVAYAKRYGVALV